MGVQGGKVAGQVRATALDLVTKYCTCWELRVDPTLCTKICCALKFAEPHLLDII